MRLFYCRYCRQMVPMFDEQEQAQLQKLYMDGLQAIQQYRQKHHLSLGETPIQELHQPFYALYQQLTGVACAFTIEEVIQRHMLARWVGSQTTAE
jgi:hypothetical protein